LTVTSSLFGPNILLNTLFSNILICSSLNVRDQVSHPHKTAGKIIILYIVCWILVSHSGGYEEDYILRYNVV
jgi:hypothetical protein